MTIAEIIVAVLVVVATICVVATTILQLRAPDALTRVNLLGTLVVVAFPILIVAKLIHSWTTTGFDINDFIRAVEDDPRGTRCRVTVIGPPHP